MGVLDGRDAAGALTNELALGMRLLDFYQNRLPVERRADGVVLATDVVEAGELRVIRLRLSHRGSHPCSKSWRLVGHADFDGSLTYLCHWARREKILQPWLDEMWLRQSPKVREAVFQFGVEQKPPIPPRLPETVIGRQHQIRERGSLGARYAV